MSLENYRRPRLVILHPRSSTREAARAMADNHIGAVLVTENQKLVGIVTDRDLALDVVAGELDSNTTTLRDVMSDEIACVDVDDSVKDVLDTMRKHACRRVPVLSEGRPVGIVTLDDLIIEGAVSLDDLRTVVCAQLEIAARFKAEGETHPLVPARPDMDTRSRARRRREARAENTYNRLLGAVERQTGLESREQAEQALRIALSNICRRLTPGEAQHLVAQLPSKLAISLDRPYEGPDKTITTETIQSDLRQTLHLIPDHAADILYAVCDVIADSVSAGEIESVRAELPTAMKDLFPTMPYRRAG
ncbi:MAG: CBS domain-containing protein [Polyangiaceae bacterium]|nr:CBS domain-containing protein [Polyangiaceae bacterium]